MPHVQKYDIDESAYRIKLTTKSNFSYQFPEDAVSRLFTSDSTFESKSGSDLLGGGRGTCCDADSAVTNYKYENNIVSINSYLRILC